MSLILKGIDLPTDGESIRLVIASSGDVVEVWRDGLAKAYYPNKAVQIPKGHGSIKDVDKIKLMARLGEVDIDRIDNAPTILDKERE